MTTATRGHCRYVVVDDNTDKPITYTWTRPEAVYISRGLSIPTRVMDVIDWRRGVVKALEVSV